MSAQYSYLYKFIIIGDSSVGKSCILLQFLEKKFKFDHDTTIGVEYGTQIVQTTTKQIKLQIWDTAGQQTFKSITRSYYRGSIGVILVYDISNRDSFKNLHKWLDDTRTYANDKISVILVGNKSDLDYKREVSLNEGLQFAQKNGLLFMESSAKTGQNIDGIFQTLSQKVNEKIQKQQLDPRNSALGVKLGNLQQSLIQNPPKRRICC